MLFSNLNPAYLYTSPEDQKKYRELEFYKGKSILLFLRKRGGGDKCMLFLFCQILREFGLDVTIGVRDKIPNNAFKSAQPHDIKGYKDLMKIADWDKYFIYEPDLQAFPVDLWNSETRRGHTNHIDHTGTELPFEIIIDFRYHERLPINVIASALRDFGIFNLDFPIPGLKIKPEYLIPYLPLKDYIVLCCWSSNWLKKRRYEKHLKLAEILKDCGHKVLNLTPIEISEMPIELFILILASSKLLVHVDSFPQHVASAIPIKKLFIWNNEMWQSSVINSYDNTDVTDDSCPEKIADHVEKILSS